MVLRNEKEQGFRTPIDLRLGINFSRFGGTDTERDPAAIADARFQSLINALLGSGPVKNRGGQSKSNTASVGAIDHICDASDIGYPYEGVNLDPLSLGLSLSAGGGRVWDVDASGTVTVNRTFAGSVQLDFFAKDGTDKLVLLSPTVVGTGAADVKKVSDGTVLVNIANIGRDADLHWFYREADLYVAWYDRAANLAKISRWDGATLSLEFSQSPGGAGSADKLHLVPASRSTVVLAAFAPEFAAGGYINNNVKKRTGVATWVDLAIPTVTRFSAFDAVLNPADNRLYWIGGDDTSLDGVNRQFRVISTDGTTVTLDRTVAALSSAGVSIGLLAADAANLYFLRGKGALSITDLKIGKYDGATWTDTVKDLAADMSLATAGVTVVGFAAGAKNFYVLIKNSSGEPQLWASPGLDITGTWTKVAAATGESAAETHYHGIAIT